MSYTKQEIFDRLFNHNHRGGRLNYEDFDNSSKFQTVRQVCEHLINFVKRINPKAPQIHFDFVASNIPNAGAIKWKGDYFIGLNIGLYNLLVDVFRKMLANPRILPTLGDASKENPSKKYLNIIVNDGSIIYEHDDENEVNPKDLLRYEFADSYGVFALSFLIFHECAHIIRGHVGYICSLDKDCSISEWNNNQNKVGYDNSFLQTIEMDADRFASNCALISASRLVQQDKQGRLVSETIHKDWPSFTKHWSFAIYTFFKIVSFNNFLGKSNFHSLSHPPSAVRLCMIYTHIPAFLDTNYDNGMQLLPEISSNFSKSASEVELAISEFISFPTSDFKNFLSTFKDQEVRKYMHSLISNWINVRPLVEPFAFSDRPID